MLNDFKTITEVVNRFSSQEECIKHLELIRWNGNVISPFDANSKVWKCSGNKYQCKNTNKYFNVMTNTLFHNTKIPLSKWFLAIYILETEGYHFSSSELARQIGLTQKTSWYLIKRIKACFGSENYDKTKAFEKSLKNIMKSNNIDLKK